MILEETNMATITIAANIIANADKIELVKIEFEKLIDITRAEEGCINYDLHHDYESPAIFYFMRTGNLENCGRHI
jgi:quinol monooxygenase YgiN